ncbi:component of SufBCD complex [Szabonella alba]|uniref:Component of SufBCD complex n=1 Tax=Szabonella alba TaxID=2804194 RepID=A0A8K0V8S8_9RHOB|nr:component of SufBCD complex [Szabonella alba]MBL4917231.1 component of SufBCD complex [Szabonella alba]
MQWYETIFRLIDMRSFSNLWFWIVLAVMWSTASHWIIGVPFDMVTRARKQGGQAMADLEAATGINTRRVLYVLRVSGSWLTGLSFFLLTSLLALGFFYGIEFAQALFLLLMPMTVVSALTLRAALRYERAPPEGHDLCRMLTFHRMKVQALGMISIFITAMWGMWQNMRLDAF